MTPDDGQRNRPKHIEFHFIKKFEKLGHLVGLIIRKFVKLHGHMNVKIKGPNYSTIVVRSRRQIRGRLCNETAHIQKKIMLKNVECCYVCKRFATKGHNLQNSCTQATCSSLSSFIRPCSWH
jgi:hypothetical protein